MSASEHLKHPTLECLLSGKPSASTIQYRGLKYASIPRRWAESTSNDALQIDSNRVFDATRFGPSCPQKRGGQAWDVSLVGDTTLAKEFGQGDDAKMDEFECLHLNITVPKTALAAKNTDGVGLPVFVWVHGGGLSLGSNSWPQYDLTKFVERSVRIGKPVIGVAINYRVNIFGFLASEELGIGGNLGYKDQAVAFRWIKKHIAGFGGDPTNITAAGESAGGISLSTLLCANIGNEGLFERVVIMSGETTLRKPRNKKWQEAMYQDQLKYLGASKLDVADRRRLFNETDAEELVQRLPLAQHFCGFIDGKWLKEDPTLMSLANPRSKLHKPDWCKEFVIGDTAHDGTILKARILDAPNTFDHLQDLCSRHLTPSQTHALLSAYQLHPPPPPAQLPQHLLHLASELRFYLPVLSAHRGWTTSSPPLRAHRYHFHIANPVPGPYKGLSSHELDVACLLLNFEHAFDAQSYAAALQMADRFVRFVNGEGWAEEGCVVVFEGRGAQEVEVGAYDKRFRGGRGKVLEGIGEERVWGLAEAWQGVRGEEGVEGRGARL
ncbi:para-nitrobenzyl esterase [Massariosphaeria phaeospora]|uniref:Para-nitrobenzyl esterase n=1 Tax=Massariosphaeria phaeospora TaxID=100035 RepID=A0A7C8MC45_9PLEO|nr:para-nitrobenzyl esterase [Massariosphaeria phaeospora]